MLGSVNVLSIHERYAYDLFSWGDYEGAVGHFLVAETPVDHVLSLFPSLAPPEFVPPGGSLEGGSVVRCVFCGDISTLLPGTKRHDFFLVCFYFLLLSFNARAAVRLHSFSPTKCLRTTTMVDVGYRVE